VSPNKTITFWGLGCVAVLLAQAPEGCAASDPDLSSARAESAGDTTARDTTPRSALLRSMLVPGWGQWYNRRPLKAGLVFTATCGLAAGTIYQNQLLQDSSAQADRTTMRYRRNTLAIWLLVAVFYGMVDAYVDAHLRDFDTEIQQMAYAVRIAPYRPALAYSLCW